jgi:SAM-dependent methyltransferase
MSVTDAIGQESSSATEARSSTQNRGSRMEPPYWISSDSQSLLDVGCNTGDLLLDYRRRYPDMQLAGIDINQWAIEIARKKVSGADIRQGYGFELPFTTGHFDCVTCIEVIEHVPQQHRRSLIAEVQRVLRPGGLFVLRCPHAGLFSGLDAQNFRFRWPWLYRKLVGQGHRDSNYQEAQEELVWHHHFSRQELLDLFGEGWRMQACERGGLLLFPVSDILRWPFYRIHRSDHPVARVLERIATLELAVNFGSSSYGILLAMRKS